MFMFHIWPLFKWVLVLFTQMETIIALFKPWFLRTQGMVLCVTNSSRWKYFSLFYHFWRKISSCLFGLRYGLMLYNPSVIFTENVLPLYKGGFEADNSLFILLKLTLDFLKCLCYTLWACDFTRSLRVGSLPKNSTLKRMVLCHKVWLWTSVNF